MQSRGLAERKIDKVIIGAKQVFNLFSGNIEDGHCRSIIRSLCEASNVAPEYKRDEILPLLMKAYYFLVKINKETFPEISLEAAQKYLALGKPDENHEFYKDYAKYNEEIVKSQPEIEKKIRDRCYDAIEKNVESNLVVALEAGKKFLKYCPQKEKTDGRYKEVTNAMLAINRKLVHIREEARKAKASAEARASSISETPAVRMYGSEGYPRAPVPRTPIPVTRSLHDNKSRRLSKKNTGVPSANRPRKK